VSSERIWCWPKPLQQPHPPVLVGSNGPRVLDRVLALGDEWIPTSMRDEEMMLSRFEELARRAGAAVWFRIQPAARVRRHGAGADALARSRPSRRHRPPFGVRTSFLAPRPALPRCARNRGRRALADFECRRAASRQGKYGYGVLAARS
jgi:alkanesulfonate monooxygenase SsuD/methylene tetrahydromethanopterin reductase-like flavin-dependent oxidoreductase (luciferase family)